MTWELLVDDYHDRTKAVLAVDASSEEQWLKDCLAALALRDQPFAVGFESKEEAEQLAERIRTLGFHCRVWTGPDPNQRVGEKHRRSRN